MGHLARTNPNQTRNQNLNEPLNDPVSSFAMEY